MTPQVRPSSSVAPIMARSLTVPQTASRPMSPPGKKIGWMTCESVVMISHPSPTRNAAPSSIAARPTPSEGSVAKPRTNSFSMSARIARPPPPCFIVTRVAQLPSAERHGAPSRIEARPPYWCQIRHVPSLRNHAGADRVVGLALGAEEPAVAPALRYRP